ncbi:MAG TPA: Nudix family hydrolase [Burkholderiales bacterium]|nr:Nudix family hydrolase [Burkholderiales bacterium]
MTPRPRIEVVAAVIERADSSFLLAQRPAGKVYAGYWEFPGGKVEAGESAAAALARELHEELAIDVEQSYPWITRDYDYEHANVRLRFRRVTRWSGEMHGREEQAFAWQRIERLTASPILPANGPILRALSLPHVYGISNASVGGLDGFESALNAALDRGLRLIQIREKQLDEDALVAFATRVRVRAHERGARVLVNASPQIAARTGADGVHLDAARLMRTSSRPELELVGASCHDAPELEHAARLGLDFVVLGPVKETASHRGARTLGWERVRELIDGYPLPVYGVGGLGTDDLHDAWTAGAHGVAAIRAAWKVPGFPPARE